MKSVIGKIVLAVFLSIFGIASCNAAQGGEATVKIVKYQYLEHNSKASLPRISGLSDAALQERINGKLQDAFLALKNDEQSSLHGDFTVSFYNGDILGLHFQGDSFTPGSVHPSKIDRGIHLDLQSGEIYKLEDLFKPGIEFEKSIKKICADNAAAYRLTLSDLYPDWRDDTFQAAWSGEERSFLLSDKAMRVYTIPNFATGPISGYGIPYQALDELINKDGRLWQRLSGKPVKELSATQEGFERYSIGNGKSGLLHKSLTLEEAKKLIVSAYGGSFIEAQEAAGEGTTARVVNVYLNAAALLEPSLKITLDESGKLYRIDIFAPEFKTTKGLHVGSTWGEIKAAYPGAKLTLENIAAFHTPDDRVAVVFSSKAPLNWEAIRSGAANPPDDLKVVRMFTY